MIPLRPRWPIAEALTTLSRTLRRIAALCLAVSQQFSENVPPLESGVRWLQPRLFDEIFGPIFLAAVNLLYPEFGYS